MTRSKGSAEMQERVSRIRLAELFSADENSAANTSKLANGAGLGVLTETTYRGVEVGTNV